MAYPNGALIKTEPRNHEEYRYLLKVYWDPTFKKVLPEKILLVLGVNPSLADEQKTDQTISTLLRIWKNPDNHYSDFIMINLYPFRSKDPKKLPQKDAITQNKIEQKIQENCNKIEDLLSKYTTPKIDFVLAFGNLIEIRDYLKESFRQIIMTMSKYHPSYKVIALTGEGNPCHPLGACHCEGTYQFLKYDKTKENNRQKRNYVLTSLDSLIQKEEIMNSDSLERFKQNYKELL